MALSLITVHDQNVSEKYFEDVTDLLPDVLAVDGERSEVADQDRDEEGRDQQDGDVQHQEEELHRSLRSFIRLSLQFEHNYGVSLSRKCF